MKARQTEMAPEPGSVLPAEVELLLAGHLGPDAAPEMFALADVHPSGRFGQAWAAVGGRRLAIADFNAAEGPRVSVTPLDKDVELEIVAGAGSSRFRVIRQGRLAEELRFSCRQGKRFSRLLHSAQRLSRGERAVAAGEAAAPAEEALCRKCGRLIPEWADTCPRCLHRRRILWRLMGYALRRKRLLYVGFGSAMAAAALDLLPPKLTQLLINNVLMPSDHRRTEWLWPLIGAMAAIIGVRVCLQHLRLNRLAQLGEYITHDLRTQAFAHLQKMSLAYFSKKPTGHLISRITQDTERLWDFVAFGIVEVVLSAVMVVGIAAILFAAEPALALLTMLPIPLSVAVTYFHVRAMRAMLRRLWAKWSGMTGVIGDVIPGVRVVKAFTQEEREIARFDGKSAAVLDDSVRVHREWTMYWPKLSLLLNLGTFAIWAYAAPRVLNRRFELGTFVMFLGYVWMFYGPVEHLGMMNRMFQRAVTSAHRVFALLDAPPTVYTKPAAARGRRVAGGIRFENVSFSYDGVKRVLQDIDLVVEPGRVIGLAGPSGGGKTTMINLVCRFYDPVEGRITIDGIDLRDWDLHDLRSQIGVVLQEPYLFQGTVAENIGYGRPGATMDQIIEAARAANAHDFIVGFPDGYDTTVGERGQTVSGGERQRLSIARAVLNNPRILILDEATSSVDSKTEMKIQEAIDRLVRGRTTIAIAHRLSTLRRADRLVILDKGKLVEQGSHDELMAADGMYAGLHKTQAQLHALFAV